MALNRTGLAEALQVPASELGAASPSGWADESFITALHSSGSLLAVGGRQRVAIYRSDGLLADAADRLPHLLAATVCSQAERVTALAWAAFPGDLGDSCLVVGTSAGWLQLHFNDGTLLHRQQLHTLPVAAVRMRASGMGVSPADEGSDMTVMFADAAARVSGLEVQSVVRLQRQSWSDPERLDPLGFTKWDLKSAGPRLDGICVGMRPRTLQALMKGSYSVPKLTILTIGSKPPLAAFEVEEHTQRGAIAMVSDIAQSLKGWIPSPMRRAKEVRLQPADPATLAAELRDDRTRTLTSLVLAPRCSLEASRQSDIGRAEPIRGSLFCRGAVAAATGTLGRVMLLDAASMAVVRLWKGYRDAQCAWLVLPRQMPSTAAASPADPQPADSQAAAKSSSPTAMHSAKRAKQETSAPPADTEVALVIYAPRKRVCDVYASRHGPLLATLQCSANCRLLQAAPQLGPVSGSPLMAACTGCLLLDLDTGSVASVRRLMGVKD